MAINSFAICSHALLLGVATARLVCWRTFVWYAAYSQKAPACRAEFFYLKAFGDRDGGLSDFFHVGLVLNADPKC